MTVSDLVALLQAQNPDLPVLFVWEEDGGEAWSNIGSVMMRIGHQLPGDEGSLMASNKSTPGFVVQMKK